MKDHFDKKRAMVKVLLDALKHSAGQEMSANMPAPMPMKPGMAEGGMVDLSQTNALQQRTSDDHMMAEGGLVGTDMAATDEPNRLTEPKSMDMDGSADSEALKNLPGPVENEDQEKDDMQNMHDADIMDEDEDNNSSSFDAFLPRRKKK